MIKIGFGVSLNYRKAAADTSAYTFLANLHPTAVDIFLPA